MSTKDSMTDDRRPTHYSVGSLGEVHRIPDGGLDADLWYELMTLTGVEWYDASGRRTESPPCPARVLPA